MRILLGVIVSIAAVSALACTKHNPASCCTTQEQCDSFGLDHIIGCQSGQVCDATGTCQMAQCTSSADCVDTPDTPVCVNRLCVAACEQDADCTGVAGKPFCASDGECVECLDDSPCTASAPVCDSSEHVCRGCTADSECPGGVCLEADGTCAPDAQVVFLTAFGGDTGTCERAAPCATLTYGLSNVSASRGVIHIDGGSFSLGSSTVTIDRPVYIDATGTKLTGALTGPVLAIGASPVALTHVKIAPGQSGQAIDVQSGRSLRVFDSTVSRGITVNGGTLAVSESTFLEGGLGSEAIKCSAGTVSVSQCTFTQSLISTSNCALDVTRSEFDETSDGSVGATGGLVTLENNLFVESYELADLASVGAVAPGSAVRFNTFVNTSSVASDGTALFCDATVEVTSNIFAYGSMHPHSPVGGCPTRYSLYDTVADPSQTGGTNDKVGDASTFFANASAGDFHLAPGSPAIGAAEPGLSVSEDHDGNARPQPAGSTPDMGAFEAP